MNPRYRADGLRELPPDIDGRLEGLLARYGPFLRDVVARLCPRHLGLDRKEIEQDALIRLWRVVESEKDIRDFESYLYRVVARVTLDAIRDVKARREEQMVVDHAESLTSSPVMPGSAIQSPEAVTSRRRLLEQVQGIIEQLSPRRRRAVKLHLLGFTTSEIAAFLGWSEPKARNLAYRGLEDLRALLTEAGVDDSQ